MIKVIKHSSKIFKGVCPRCYCEFTYEPEDLKENLQIQCPDCGYWVYNDRLFDEETHAPIPYIDYDKIKFPHLSDNPPGFVSTGPRACENCTWYKEMLSSPNKIYAGDTPCTWCETNRITCATAYFNQSNTQSQHLINNTEIKTEVNNDHSN